MNFLGITNVSLLLEDTEHAEEAGEDALGVDPHQMGVVLAEGGRGLLQMVVRDLDEQMVDLVRPDVVRQMMRPAVIPVHTRQLT